jgi:hypothetical protein
MSRRAEPNPLLQPPVAAMLVWRSSLALSAAAVAEFGGSAIGAARMLLRWALRVVALTIVHALASCVIVVIAIAQGMSGGVGWVVGGFFILMFFPWLLLNWAGIEPVPFDSPLAVAFNSLTWVAIVSALFLVGSRFFRKRREGTLRAQETKRPNAAEPSAAADSGGDGGWAGFLGPQRVRRG